VWDDLVVSRCPVAEISPFSRRALRDYVRLRDHSLLPRSGGAGEQEARTMRAIEIVRQELFKPERERVVAQFRS